MHYVVRFLGIGGLLGLVLTSFTNFAPVQGLNVDAASDFTERLSEDLKSGKQYVKIGGKYYEKNDRGVYHIDGVPTFVKTGKRANAEQPQPDLPGKTGLGQPIDPKIYKDAMGLHEDDAFFKPKTTAED